MRDFTSLRFALRSFMASQPGVYFCIQRFRPSRKNLLVSKDTEVVIEGYPRSANTYAVAAFLLAQGRPVKIAHHLHVPAQVIRGVQWGIPTIVLIREPEEAVLSLLVREPKIGAMRALKDYINFYRSIASYRAGFVVAPFEEVVSDFGQVIVRINKRFGTSFVPFSHTEENVRKVFALIEEMDKIDQKKGIVSETTVARPSAIREAIKEKKKRELMDSEAESLLQEAKCIYNMVMSWK